MYAAAQDPDIQRWTTIPSPYLPEHARSFTDAVGPRGLGERLDVHLRSLPPRRGGTGGHARPHHALPERGRDRLLGHKGAPRQRLCHRGRRRRLPLGLHPPVGGPAWNGVRRSATEPPARWRNAPASSSRASCAPRSSTRAYAGTAGWARCCPRTWACRRRRPYLPAPAACTGRPVAPNVQATGRLSVPPPIVRTMTTPRPTTDLSADDARRIALRAQGFLGAPDRRAGVRGVLRHLGAVQLDTISVLARSHELIPYARLGAVGRKTVESAYWRPRPTPRTPSSTGRTPRASSPSRSGPTSPSAAAPTAAARTGTTPSRTAPTTRSSSSSAPKAPSRPRSWAAPSAPASGGTGPAPRSPSSAR